MDLNRIIPGITSFAWNANCSKIAICPQSREVLIFETGNQPDITKWKLAQVLKEVSPAQADRLALQRHQLDALAPEYQ